MSLSSIKIKIRQVLPTSFFDISLRVWRNTIQRILLYIDTLKLKGFTKSQTISLNHNGIDFKIVVDPKNGFIDQYLFIHGVYEDFILDLMHKYLPVGGTMFDVGANIGQHSLFAAKHIGESGAIYSFEPITSLYEQFLESINLNNFTNIKAYNYACGNETATKDILINYQNIGQSSLVTNKTLESKILVNVKKLDDEFKHINKIDLIKIDVEGYEYEVLLGAKDLLSRTKPVIILEYSPTIYDLLDSSISEKLLDMLLSGHKVIDVEDGYIEIRDKKSYMLEFKNRNRMQTNLLCLPR